MKTLRYLLLGSLATLLMAADCSNKDSEFYNDVFVNSPELVTIDNAAPHLAGDPVMVSAELPRALYEAGQTGALDLYRTTGGATAFTFSYLIEKETGANQWTPIDISENLVLTEDGNALAYGDFLLAQAVYDAASETYLYRGGIRMAQTGNYRLRFTYNQEPSGAIVLTSDSAAGSLFVTIFSSCAQTDASGYYYFTVN